MKARLTILAAAFALLVLQQQVQAQLQKQNYDERLREDSLSRTSEEFSTRPSTQSVDLASFSQPVESPSAEQSPDSEDWLSSECDNCDGSSCDDCCGDVCRTPRRRTFGEFLYLRPGNDKVAYAVPINGAIVPPQGAAPVQIGLEAVVDNDFRPAFRTGFSRVLNECANMGATYTHFESSITGRTSINAPYVLRSLVSHPGSRAAPTDFLQGSAVYGVDFQLADLDYRRAILQSDRSMLHYLIGIRYAHLGQDFSSELSNATTTETVTTDIRFDGGGIRVGLEGERHACGSGLMIYGRGMASFLGGAFRSRYTQANNFDGTVVNTGWKDDRIVSLLELELGLGWTSRSGCFRLTSGYLISGWYNVIKTDDFIAAVQSNNSRGVGDSLTFDGLVARAEIRW